MPLALSDEQLATVTDAAALLPPGARDNFLRSVRRDRWRSSSGAARLFFPRTASPSAARCWPPMAARRTGDALVARRDLSRQYA